MTGRLHSVEPLPPPPERFAIEALKGRASLAHQWGVRYFALKLAKDHSPTAEDPAGLMEASVQSGYFLLELNNTYQSLQGTRVELVAHSELKAEDFGNKQNLTLVRLFHPVTAIFSGFNVVDVHGLCVVTGEVDESRHFPLEDIEDIWERNLL